MIFKYLLALPIFINVLLKGLTELLHYLSYYWKQLSSNSILKAFKTNDNKVIRLSSKANKMVVNLSKNNKSRNLTYVPNIEIINVHFKPPILKKPLTI